jgi:hypothetical protein
MRIKSFYEAKTQLNKRDLKFIQKKEIEIQCEANIFQKPNLCINFGPKQ